MEARELVGVFRRYGEVLDIGQARRWVKGEGSACVRVLLRVMEEVGGYEIEYKEGVYRGEMHGQEDAVVFDRDRGITVVLLSDEIWEFRGRVEGVRIRGVEYKIEGVKIEKL